MPTIAADFDDDPQTVKDRISAAVGPHGTVSWSGDSGTFSGSGVAGGATGTLTVAANPQGGTAASMDYSLPFRLKLFAGQIDDGLRQALTAEGARLR